MRTCLLTQCALLTANVNPSCGLHRHSVAVVRITRNMLHVGRHVVDDRHHVPRGILTHQVSAHVERNGRSGVAQGQTQNGHGTALRNVVRRMHSGGLQVVECGVHHNYPPKSNTHNSFFISIFEHSHPQRLAGRDPSRPPASPRATSCPAHPQPPRRAHAGSSASGCSSSARPASFQS